MSVTPTSLMMWIEKGHTLSQAEKSGKATTEAWDECYFGGLFDIEEDGRLTLTPDGVRWLADERAGTG